MISKYYTNDNSDSSLYTYSSYRESLDQNVIKALEEEYNKMLIHNNFDKDNALKDFTVTLTEFSCDSIYNLQKDLVKAVEAILPHFNLTNIRGIELSSCNEDYYSDYSSSCITITVDGYIKKESFLTKKIMAMYYAELELENKKYMEKTKELKEKEIYIRLKAKYGKELD